MSLMTRTILQPHFGSQSAVRVSRRDVCLIAEQQADGNRFNEQKNSDDKRKGVEHERILGERNTDSHKYGEKDCETSNEKDNSGTIGTVMDDQLVLVEADKRREARVDEQTSEDDKHQGKGEKKIPNAGHTSLTHFG